MEACLIIILWSAITLFLIIQYTPALKEVPTKDQVIAAFIFIIGGPIFIIANILESLLDYILPEGWNDDDDFKGY